MNHNNIFISTTEQKILKFLADHFGRAFFDKEIADKTKASRGAANMALRKLVKKKMILRERKGRMNFYSVDIYNPLIKQFKILGNIVLLQPLVQWLKDYSLQIILFGSAGRGENVPASDFDLFVLARNKEGAAEAISRFDKKGKIKPIIKNPNEWAELAKKDKTFLGEVEEGVILHENHE